MYTPTVFASDMVSKKTLLAVFIALNYISNCSLKMYKSSHRYFSVTKPEKKILFENSAE